jgi:hypothetical protein
VFEEVLKWKRIYEKIYFIVLGFTFF